MRMVMIESPYAGDVERNARYARRALADSITRGECPFAGHLLYTQVLDDTVSAEREQGIALHLAWLEFMDCMVLYADYGVSTGMSQALVAARACGMPVEVRTIGEND